MTQFETDDINKAAAIISTGHSASNIVEKNNKLFFIFDDVDSTVLRNLALENLKVDVTKFTSIKSTIYQLIKNVK